MWPFKKRNQSVPGVRSHGEWKGPASTNGRGYADLESSDSSCGGWGKADVSPRAPRAPRCVRNIVMTYSGCELKDTSVRAASRAAGALRRAAEIQRTVAWANRAAIDLIYAASQPGQHVDHIIPLRGDLVSGLHVEYNLQHLSGADNLSKSNHFDPDTYVHVLPGE